MRNLLHVDRTATSRILAGSIAATLCCSPLANAQSTEPSRESVLTIVPSRRPITPQQRREWLFDGIAGPKSIGAGLMSGTWQTAVDSPREWNGASGFTRRVLAYEAHNGVSTGIEASLGVFWGEDPRRMRSGRARFARRLEFAAKTVVLAPRPDGHLAPAWARYAGAVGSNVVENAWLPSRLTTPRATARRLAAGLVSRLALNLWTEFGPDLLRGLARAVGSTRGIRPTPKSPEAEGSALAATSTRL
jgi:hypothetical protein